MQTVTAQCVLLASKFSGKYVLLFALYNSLACAPYHRHAQRKCQLPLMPTIALLLASLLFLWLQGKFQDRERGNTNQ